MKTSEYIVAFHIGRGGRFNNPGHKTFIESVKELSDCFGDSIIDREDEDGNPLPDDQWTLIDSGGNITLQGRAQIESKTGVIDWDGEYDTDIVKYLDECDDEEIEVIYKSYLMGDWMPVELIKYVCDKMGKHRIENIEYQANFANIKCHDGEFQYDWDGQHDVTEDEIAAWMLSKDIDPFSIENFAYEFEDIFYLE